VRCKSFSPTCKHYQYFLDYSERRSILICSLAVLTASRTPRNVLWSLPVLALVVLPVSIAHAQDQYCGAANAATAVLVVHGGAFVIGTPDATADSCKAFAQQGWRAVNLDYPLGDLAAAGRYVHAAAVRERSRRRTVFVYGESAGGGLAALAAARGWVDGGFAWAPVTDLVSWKAGEARGLSFWDWIIDSSRSTLKSISAITWASRHSAPLLVVHGRSDQLVSLSQSQRLKLRWPKMTLQITAGGHEQFEPSYLNATKTSLTYLKKLLAAITRPRFR